MAPVATRPGISRAAFGLRPTRICVAPAKTMTAKDSASVRCAIQPAASVDDSAPSSMPGGHATHDAPVDRGQAVMLAHARARREEHRRHAGAEREMNGV